MCQYVVVDEDTQEENMEKLPKQGSSDLLYCHTFWSWCEITLGDTQAEQNKQKYESVWQVQSLSKSK